MATIDVVVNAAGQVVERVFLTETEQRAYTGQDLSGAMQLPDAPVGSWQGLDTAPTMALVEPDVFHQSYMDLPPEVAAALQPGVNPFASMEQGSLQVMPPSIAPAPTAGMPAPAGSGVLLPAIGALPPAIQPQLPLGQQVVHSAVLQSPAGMPNAMIPDWDRMPAGRVVMGTSMRNRQKTGVRIGLLPQVVWEDM